MTKYEKISLVFSVVAIVVSLATSILFSSVRQELYYVGRLTATYGLDSGNDSVKITVKNTGYKPVSGISIGLRVRSEGISLPINIDEIAVNPIARIRLDASDNAIFIISDEALGRDDIIQFSIPISSSEDLSPFYLDNYIDLSVFSEMGHTEPLVVIFQRISGRGF